MKRYSAALLIVFSMLFAGCKKGDASASTEDEVEEAAPARSPTQALGHKLGAYITCLNAFSKDVYHGRRIWLDQFDAAKGPRPKQANTTLYGPLALGDPQACRDQVAAVKAMAPRLPALEIAGDAYVAAIVAVQPLTVELRAHFDQRDYKDDKLAHAIAVHPKLMAAYEAFITADHALGDQVDKLEDQLASDQLAELEKAEGKRLRWHHKHTLIEAKQVVALAAAVSSPFEITDLAPLTAALAAYDGAVSAYATYYAANKAEIEADSRYRSLETDAKNLLKDAKAMLRRVRDHQPFSYGEKMTIGANNGEAVEGHPARVIASYNALIDTSNWGSW